MTIARRLTRSAAAGLLGTTVLVAATVLTAAPANAEVDGSKCKASWDVSRNLAGMRCYNPVDSVWDLQVQCDRFSGTGFVLVKGTRVYGAGWGTSIAQCPVGTEIGDETVVDL